MNKELVLSEVVELTKLINDLCGSSEKYENDLVMRFAMTARAKSLLSALLNIFKAEIDNTGQPVIDYMLKRRRSKETIDSLGTVYVKKEIRAVPAEGKGQELAALFLSDPVLKDKMRKPAVNSNSLTALVKDYVDDTDMSPEEMLKLLPKAWEGLVSIIVKEKPVLTK